MQVDENVEINGQQIKKLWRPSYRNFGLLTLGVATAWVDELINLALPLYYMYTFFPDSCADDKDFHDILRKSCFFLLLAI